MVRISLAEAEEVPLQAEQNFSAMPFSNTVVPEADFRKAEMP